MSDAKKPEGLMSDDEEEKGSKAAIVENGLKDAATLSVGVSVDQKMMEGARRGNRAFTVAMGKSVADTEEHKEFVRKDKRSNTLPAMGSRRGDFALTDDVMKKLNELQENMKKRGSIAQAPCVDEEDLLEYWNANVECHVYGKMTEGQQPADEREWGYANCSAGNLPSKIPFPIASCTKGCKGRTDTSPNQDNFSITYCNNGWRIGTCLDGHGPNGHLVAHRAVQTLPYYIMKNANFPDNMRDALREAFDAVQRDLLAIALAEGYDVQASGSCAVAACWKGSKLWTAHCGDSRLVIGYETDKRLQFETQDHKPDDPEEKQRIEESGGEVRTYKYDDGWSVHRIFVKGQNYPGLCMARSLGDNVVKDHGVVATPVVHELNLDLGEKPFILMASDGVWEFLDSEFVVKAIVKKMPTDGAEKIVQKLHRESRKRWREEEGDYCDDITSVLVLLREE